MHTRQATNSSLLPLFLAIAALASACGSESPTSPTAAVDTGVPRRVVVLGDSLAVSPTEGQSFPAELQRLTIAMQPGWTVANAGVSGDTTAGGARRVDPLLSRDVAVLVVALGANDGLGGVPIPMVEANLSTIITTAQARGIAVLICGMETPPTYGWDYTLAFHEVFPRLARRHNVPLVPFLLNGVALVPEMNGPDGVHPNAAGARRIAQNVWPYLEPLLRASAPVRSASSSRAPSPGVLWRATHERLRVDWLRHLAFQ